MNCTTEAARPLAYLLIGAGCVLALASALEPQATGAYHLQAGYLLCGLIPYIVYGSLTDILDGPTLLVSGLGLLAVDLLARVGFAVTAAAQAGDVVPALWLCTLLVLVVLPLGAGAGKGFARLCS